MNSSVIAFVFARGGSKGVPGKNIRLLAGKPLIAYSIEVSLESKWIDRVIVSTEDEEIAAVAREYGAEVPFIRPMELATDDASERLAWQHAIREYRKIHGESSIDVFVSVPPTAPLRKVEDIDRCIESLLDSDADMVYTVSSATRSPYMNIVEVDQAGYAQLAIQSSHKPFRRQDTPVLYDSATIAYAARPDHILVSDYFFDGRVKAVVSPKERAWDIDTELDFKIAEYLMSNS